MAKLKYLPRLLMVVVCVLRTFKYRLYPNEEQETVMNNQLRMLCSLYNILRNEKITKHSSLNSLRKLALERRGNESVLLEVPVMGAQATRQ